MSGGAWNYRQYHIEELAQMFAEASEIRALLLAAAETEHLADWAVCCDTSPEVAAREIFDLWVKTFDELYDR